MGKDPPRSEYAEVGKKRIRAAETIRPMTTSLYQLRALELGIRKQDLRFYTCGQIFGLLTERANDKAEWPKKATQDDINKLFPQ